MFFLNNDHASIKFTTFPALWVYFTSVVYVVPKSCVNLKL